MVPHLKYKHIAEKIVTNLLKHYAKILGAVELSRLLLQQFV